MRVFVRRCVSVCVSSGWAEMSLVEIYELVILPSCSDMCLCSMRAEGRLCIHTSHAPHSIRITARTMPVHRFRSHSMFCPVVGWKLRVIYVDVCVFASRVLDAELSGWKMDGFRYCAWPPKMRELADDLIRLCERVRVSLRACVYVCVVCGRLRAVDLVRSRISGLARTSTKISISSWCVCMFRCSVSVFACADYSINC